MSVIERLRLTFLGAIEWRPVGTICALIVAATAVLHATHAAIVVEAIVLGGGASALAAATLLGPIRLAARSGPSNLSKHQGLATDMSPAVDDSDEARRNLDVGPTSEPSEIAVARELAPAAKDARPLSDLISRAREGDAEAWNEIVYRFSGLVQAVARAYRLSPTEAADVTQTTWMHLVKHLDRIQDPEGLRRWLAMTALRESLRHISLTSRELTVDDDAVFDALAGDRAASSLLMRERDEALRRAFKRLSERCQTLLLMLAAPEPPSYEEIGAMLDMSVGAIGATRARCRAKLLQAMQEEYGDVSSGNTEELNIEEVLRRLVPD